MGTFSMFAAACPIALIALAVMASDPPPRTSADAQQPVPEPARVLSLSQQASAALKRGELSHEVVARQQAIVDILSRMLGDAQTIQDGTPQPASSERPLASSAGKGPAAGTSPRDAAGGARRSEGAESSGLAAAATGEALGDLKRREGLADAVWGHLPPRIRDELYRSYTERYVPQYDQLLRQYFEALADTASSSAERQP